MKLLILLPTLLLLPACWDDAVYGDRFPLFTDCNSSQSDEIIEYSKICLEKSAPYTCAATAKQLFCESDYGENPNHPLYGVELGPADEDEDDEDY